MKNEHKERVNMNSSLHTEQNRHEEQGVDMKNEHKERVNMNSSLHTEQNRHEEQGVDMKNEHKERVNMNSSLHTEQTIDMKNKRAEMNEEERGDMTDCVGFKKTKQKQTNKQTKPRIISKIRVLYIHPKQPRVTVVSFHIPRDGKMTS